jgi:outer membrane protein assembly factor BamB
MIQPQPLPPLVVLTLQKRLVAVNALTGQHVWEHEVRHPEGRMLVEQGLVFYVLSDQLLCLDYQTGTKRWEVKLPKNVGLGMKNLLVYAGCVLVTAMGETASFAVEDGRSLWHDPFKGYGVGSGPMAAPGVSAQVDWRHQ